MEGRTVTDAAGVERRLECTKSREGDLRVTLPTGDGMRDVYLYDPQPDPASLEAGLRYIGRSLG